MTNPASSAADPILADTAGGVTDRGGHTTRFTVNKWGQPLVALAPLNDTTVTTYEGHGLVTNVHQPFYPAGVTDTLIYDTVIGLPTVVRPAGSERTNIRYAKMAQPDSIWGAGQMVDVSPKLGQLRIGGSVMRSAPPRG